MGAKALCSLGEIMEMSTGSSERRALEAKATRLLQSRGFTWAGTSAKKFSAGQVAFEKRLICTVPPGSGKRR